MLTHLALLAPLLLPGAALAQGPAPATVSAGSTPGPAQLRGRDRGRHRRRPHLRPAASLLAHLAAHPARPGTGPAPGRGRANHPRQEQDRTQEPHGSYTPVVFLVHAGVRVVTSRFNLTKAADTRNAENVVILDSPEVATWFLANWERRRAASRAFTAE